MTHEFLQFWLLLCEEPGRLAELTAQLTEEERYKLRDSSFATLVTDQLGVALAKALIDKFLKQISLTDTDKRRHDRMCQRLNSVCPSLFNLEDMKRAQVR